jgi:hypothetical protein
VETINAFNAIRSIEVKSIKLSSNQAEFDSNQYIKETAFSAEIIP